MFTVARIVEAIKLALGLTKRIPVLDNEGLDVRHVCKFQVYFTKCGMMLNLHDIELVMLNPMYAQCL